MEIDEPLNEKYSWKYLVTIIGALIFILINLIGSYQYGAQILVGFTPDMEVNAPGLLVAEVREASAAEQGGLRPGDLITSVNHQHIDNVKTYDAVVADLSAGKPLLVKITREQQQLELTIIPRQRLNNTRFIAGVMLVLVSLLVGLVCYLKSPDDSRAQVALLLFLATAAYHSHLIDYRGAGNLIDQTLAITNIILNSISLALIGVLPLYIPERKKLLDRHPAALLLVIAPAFVLGVFSISNYYVQLYDLPYRLIDEKWFAWIDLHLLHGLFIYGPLMLLHTYRYATSNTVRRQAKTMLYGITCWAGINTFILFAGENLKGSALGDPFYAQLIDVLLPITVFFTIYRHKLFDIDLLIRKSIIYTVASSVLVVIYFTLVAGTSWVIAFLFNYENSVIAVAFSTMMVGFGFAPVRRYSQRLVNRMFFREKHDYLELINQLLLELTATLDLDRIAELLAVKLKEGMKLKNVVVMIPDDQQSCYFVRAWQGDFSERDPELSITPDIEPSAPDQLSDKLILRGDDAIPNWLNTNRSSLPVTRLNRLSLSAQQREIAEKLKAELFVPIALRQLDAILVLGEKQSEAGFDEEDYQFITTIAHQAAIVMENARLFELATYDGLTSLMRRTAFEGVFEDEIRRCRRYNRPLSLLMLDIDHFKRFNDTYGHLTGDLVLKRVATGIKEQLRATDTPSRYGGEEFCVLLSETGQSAAIKVAENLRKKISTLKLTSPTGEPLQITASIGIFSAAGPQLPEATEIYARADAALYQAKSDGRNCVKVATAGDNVTLPVKS